jgi:hydrogenase expression/formation protein HypC
MCLAIPGLLERREVGDPLMPMGTVRFGGIRKDVCLACVPEAEVGQYVLVHAGIGIGVVDEAEAMRILRSLREMADAGETP